MLDYQILYPTDRYSTKIESAKTYVIYDPISVEDNTNDDLAYALDKKNITRDDKLFIFNAYLFQKNYHDRAVYVPEFILDHCDQYKQHFKDLELNFNKTVPFNYQLYSLRHTRAIATCCLKNMFYQKVDFIYSQPWELNGSYLSYLNAFMKSNNLDLKADFLPFHEFDVPGSHHACLNVFQSSLKKNMFDPCAISIVHEPVETDCGAVISEKYINALYSGTIPIVLGYKIYDVLDQLGFDTFSDIIDTTSQHVEDPKMRVFVMLDKNRHILKSDALLLMKDKKIQDRLNHNFNLIRDLSALRDSFIKLNDQERYQQALYLIMKNEKLYRRFYHFADQFWY